MDKGWLLFVGIMDVMIAGAAIATAMLAPTKWELLTALIIVLYIGIKCIIAWKERCVDEALVDI